MNTEIKHDLYWLTLYRRTLNKWDLKYFKICFLFFGFFLMTPCLCTCLFSYPACPPCPSFPFSCCIGLWELVHSAAYVTSTWSLHLILPLQSRFHTGSWLTEIGNEHRPYFSPASPGALSIANLPYALLIKSANGLLVGLDIFHYFSSTYSSVLPS